MALTVHSPAAFWWRVLNPQTPRSDPVAHLPMKPHKEA